MNNYYKSRVKIIDDTDEWDKSLSASNPWKWDGSDLGRYKSKDIVLDKVEKMELRYLHLRINGYPHFCIVKKMKNNHACLFDEMKPLFGLSKLGTHSIKIDDSHCILISPTVKGANVIYEYKLSEVSPLIDIDNEDNRDFVCQVRNVFIFREILGLTINNESSIRLRWNETGYLPVSFKETSSIVQDEKSMIPNTVLDKWFKKTNLIEATRQFLRIDAKTDIPEFLFNLRMRIEETIERVNKHLIWMSVYIIERIEQRITIGEEEYRPWNLKSDIIDIL